MDNEPQKKPRRSRAIPAHLRAIKRLIKAFDGMKPHEIAADVRWLIDVYKVEV